MRGTEKRAYLVKEGDKAAIELAEKIANNDTSLYTNASPIIVLTPEEWEIWRSDRVTQIGI